ncbi:MAG: acetyl esterase/lipase [Arenicella sp.]|jgi:acetyl esterase/lipase
MKNLLIIIAIITMLVTAVTWFISDRDRGLWLVTAALKIVNPIESITGLAYGNQDWQKLDVYPQADTAPVIIFIHGGSWRHGRKDQYLFAADAFYRQGYTVVLPDYLKYPDQRAKYPSFAVDGAKAVAWVKQNISEYNGDPSQVFVVGHSAGAHTTMMLATDKQFLNAEGLAPSDLKGVVGIAGPYSFIPDWEVTQTVFGPPANYPLMDALNYVDGDEPSTLLLHSAGDVQVGQYNQQKMQAALKSKGVDSEAVLYNALGHIDMVTHLHPWFSKEDNLMVDIHQFIQKRL